MQFKIELKKVHSLTTATDIFESAHAGAVEAVEFTEKILTFQLPRTKVSPGSLASLECTLLFQKSVADATPSLASTAGAAPTIVTIDFPVTAKIVFCEPTDTSLMRTGFELRQYDRGVWLQFIKSATEEQERVDTLLSAMKGVPRAR